MTNLSNRVHQVKPSATLAVSARAAELKAQGKDIIGLGVGEPDFDTPEHIKNAAKKALDAGQTKYTAVDGIPSLKQAIINKFKNDNGFDYKANQIIVSTGAKQALYNAMQALINPGDEVVIPAPYWVSYPSMVKLAEGTPIEVFAGHDQHFKITPDQLSAAITTKTKLLILNSPSNPTGVAYSATELKALADVLLKHPHVYVLTDDIYEHILWDDEAFHNILNVCPELYDRTIVINGVSKAYAMTGWRIGYTAGPEDIIKAMKKIQSQSTSNPCSIAQAAAEEALKGDQSNVAMMRDAFKKRHDLVFEGLNQIPGFECTPAHGTFYSFPNVTSAMKALNISDDVAFAEHLLNEAGVAVVPGTAFGAPGYIRLSYAASETVLTEALNRIRGVVK